MSRAQTSLTVPSIYPASAVRTPRLGFIGTGWIGRLRMQALLEADCAQFCAVHDPSEEAAAAAAGMASGIQVHRHLDDLLQEDLDGVVIATPSAMHADQCLSALAAGKAVFCQKPLARTRAETAAVVAAARDADRLLGVDFSYRHLAGMGELRQLISSGELGDIFAVDLVFHNAYGPDKPWFYEVAASGGGCVMDLGIHLVDLAMWLLDRTEVSNLSSSLFQQGRPLQPPFQVVEDYATASFDLGSTRTRLTCSWNLHAGRDAVIEAHFHGTQGGAALRNVNGSFYDFEIHHFTRTSARQIAGYPDAWGGRALIDWVARLSQSNAFDAQAEQALKVADVIDRIYCR